MKKRQKQTINKVNKHKQVKMSNTETIKDRC